eukprot:gene23142-31461_t
MAEESSNNEGDSVSLSVPSNGQITAGNPLSIFTTLDAPFIHFDRRVEPILWQGKDIFVQQSYDLKIPASAGSTIKYSFSTQIGDINFATQFLTPGLGADVVIQPMRVPSDEETINGSFKSVRDGIFLLNFDNSYSWFNPKLLSYQIALFQPAFTLADSNRCTQSRKLLSASVEDTRKAQLRLFLSQEKCSVVNHEITHLENRVQALCLEIDQKKGILKSARDEMDEMAARIKFNLEKQNGLSIRLLDKKLLTTVLSFLGKSSSAYYTCKYWRACLDDLAQQGFEEE